MPVMLSVFDSKLGPIPFIVIPKDFERKIVDSIVNTFDITLDKDEILVKEFEDMGMKSFNLQFKFRSPLARGGTEMVQITVVTTEANPPERMIKEKLLEFKAKIVSNPISFKGLYKSITVTFPESMVSLQEREVDAEYGFIRRMVEELESETSIGVQKTITSLESVSTLIERQTIKIPPLFMNEMKRISYPKKDGDFFMVFSNEGPGNVVIKTFITDKKVFLLKVEVESLDPNVLMRLRRIVPFECIYTSGFCQKKCTYEAYFKFDGNFDDIRFAIEKELRKITSFKRFEMSPVERG